STGTRGTSPRTRSRQSTRSSPTSSPASADQARPMSAGTERRPVVAVAIVALLGVGVLSLFIGVSRVTPAALWHGDDQAWRLLWVSRLPRLAAVVLAGSALAVAGLIMQGLTQNRFVSPTTAGTVEAASCGAMVAVLLFGGASVAGRMAFAVVFALAATGI